MTNEEKESQETSEQKQENSIGNKSSELEHCQRELQEWKDKTFRMAADFENSKKRLEKDQIVWQRMIQADVFLKLLDIVDNFDRALEQEKAQAHDAHLAGFALIRKDLQKMLESFDVKEMADSREFNPALHESIMTVQSPQHTSGDVVQVLQKGYMFKDQVLRPAKVSIAE